MPKQKLKDFTDRRDGEDPVADVEFLMKHFGAAKISVVASLIGVSVNEIIRAARRQMRERTINAIVPTEATIEMLSAALDADKEAPEGEFAGNEEIWRVMVDARQHWTRVVRVSIGEEQ